MKKAKELGFEAYCLDAWKITDQLGQFGQFDLVLQCGNLEYFRLIGEPEERYKDFCKVVKTVLKPNGKYFVTSCHQNIEFDFDMKDLVKVKEMILKNDNKICKKG